MSQGLKDKRLWIGLGISAFFMVFLFRKIDGEKMADAFRQMNAWYLLPAVGLTFLSYYFRAVRWKYLVLPLKRTSMGNLFSSTIIGYMANNLLPARLGEFVRAWMLGKKETVDTSAVFATLVLDRLFDGFTVLLILLLTLLTLQFPAGHGTAQQSLTTGGYITLGIYLLVVVFLILLKRNTAMMLDMLGKLLAPFPARFSEKIIPLAGSFIGGIRLSSGKGDLFALVWSSAIIWFLAVLPIDLALRAFGVQQPFSVSMFILVLLVFAVMVPASPGYVGTYHAACVYGLLAFDIPKEKALSIALVVHSVNFFPVIALGLFFLWKDNLSLVKIGEVSPR